MKHPRHLLPVLFYQHIRSDERPASITARLFLATLALSLLTCRADGQSRFSGHFLPRVIANGQLADRLRWTATGELEWIWLRRTEGQPARLAPRPNIANLELGIDYQLTTDLNTAAGYLLGWRDLSETETDVENRFLQQLTLTSRLGKFRARGRLRTEQRFFRQEGNRVIHRLRGRLSIDAPLQGERLDPGEPYLNTTAEWLANLSLAQPMRYGEYRLYAGIGWQLPGGQRLEPGLEWRDRLANARGDRRQALFWRLTFTL